MSEIEHELRCRWQGTDQPRAIVKRHEDDCEDDECRGCLPCPRYHCILCGIKHVDQQTCPECVGIVRDDLRDIASMFLALPDHAVSGGGNGKLEASRDLLGGEAMNMLVPGGQRGEIGIGEHRPTENVLGDWENDWRKITGSRTDDLVSVEGARAFLDDRMSWAAQHHPAFDAFAEELREHRGHLEDVLHAGERSDGGAPCLQCGTTLVKEWSEGCSEDCDPKDEGHGPDNHDRWRCPKRSCPVAYVSGDELSLAVKATARMHAEWLTATDMLAEYRIPVGTLQSWASRRKVRKRRDFDSGRMTYNVAEALVERDKSERIGA